MKTARLIKRLIVEEKGISPVEVALVLALVVEGVATAATLIP